MKIKITESQFNNLRKACRPILNENIEAEIDAEDVDLSSFKTKTKLADILWDNDTLDSRVRLQLLDIADDFVEYLGFEDVKYKDIILTGSICNFNWSNQSDIDVHIVYDLSDISDNVELVRAYVNTKKNEWNEMHSNLTIHGFEVEMYVEDVNEKAVSNGVYSLEKNKWLQYPDKSKIILSNKNTIKDIAAEIATMIDDLEDCYYASEIDSDLEKLQTYIETLIDFIHSMRKRQLNSEGEMSIGNIAYKFLRREGYMDKLYELQNNVYDSLNSI